MLRENEARNEQLRDGNEELLNERRGLIQRIELMEKDTNEACSKASESQNTVKERDV